MVDYPDKNMSLVVGVVVVIGVDYTNVVKERSGAFEGNAASDMDLQNLVVLHVGLYPRGNNRLASRSGWNGNILSRFKIISR